MLKVFNSKPNFTQYGNYARYTQLIEYYFNNKAKLGGSIARGSLNSDSYTGIQTPNMKGLITKGKVLGFFNLTKVRYSDQYNDFFDI